MVYWGCIGIMGILKVYRGLYRENGKENGNYHLISFISFGFLGFGGFRAFRV